MDFRTGSSESTPFEDLSNTVNISNSDDRSSLSASADAQQLTTSSILLDVVETSGDNKKKNPNDNKTKNLNNTKTKSSCCPIATYRKNIVYKEILTS
jgi:hypothetical protein